MKEAEPMLGRETNPTGEIDLDLRGLKCPLPALKTRAALAKLSRGSVLAVAVTDPMAVIDIPHVVAESRDEMIDQTVEGPVLTFRIRRVGPEVPGCND